MERIIRVLAVAFWVTACSNIPLANPEQPSDQPTTTHAPRIHYNTRYVTHQEFQAQHDEIMRRLDSIQDEIHQITAHYKD